MVTNYPQRLTASSTVTSSIDDGAIVRAIVRLGQWFCGLRGHDAVLHFEGSRVMMRCASCGHDSPGWEISGRAPRRRYDGDARHHLIARPALALRKTA